MRNDALWAYISDGAQRAMAITHGLRWKVSPHLGGIAGSVTVFVLLFGPDLLTPTPLVALVGWARWRGTNAQPCQPLRVALGTRSWLRLHVETPA